jgi:hypothetical protein
MNRTSKAIIWSILFVVLLLAADQFMLRVEFTQPQMQVARSFYLDFRNRLIALGSGGDPASVEAVIESTQTDTTPGVVLRRNEGDSPSYLYLDADGVIQFADSLEEIPRELRSSAERLAD